MKLKTCKKHPEKVYSLKESCPICNEKTEDAHYKFIKVKDAPKDDIKED